MKSMFKILAYASATLAGFFAFTALAETPAVGCKDVQDFTGAFVVEHVVNVNVQEHVAEVDVVGTGCATFAMKATCDNHNTQRQSLADFSGTATYTIYTPAGSIKLAIIFDASQCGYDPVNSKVWFGGTFSIVPNSGTGVYRHATGGGVWSGTAEGTLMIGANPPGPGRWAFWGTLTRSAK